MSLIVLGARSYLDRRQAWGNPASQLSTLAPDELKALLQMAQAEGQREVERWVRDAMSSRGIYASKRSPIRIQSKMAPSEWLEKAMALILAGGIAAGMWGGAGNLPTVDQSAPAQQPAVVQVYEQNQLTMEQQTMVDQVESLYASAGMRLPASTTVEWDCDHINNWQGGGKYFSSTDKICMVKGDVQTLVHEYAHAWDHHNLSNTDREQYRQAVNERMEDIVGEPDRFTTWLGRSHNYTDRAGEQFARQMEQHLFPSERDQYYMPDIINSVIR